MPLPMQSEKHAVSSFYTISMAWDKQLYYIYVLCMQTMDV